MYYELVFTVTWSIAIGYDHSFVTNVLCGNGILMPCMSNDFLMISLTTPFAYSPMSHAFGSK